MRRVYYSLPVAIIVISYAVVTAAVIYTVRFIFRLKPRQPQTTITTP
ncbi:MAG: hypothetical protein HC845_10385 [Akkermansiaceae bacterium]|nr:hypothetical protein [Akkermansiaceae bacterium]